MKKQRHIRISEDSVLFENSNYLALNKPIGFPSHATVDKKRDNVFDALRSFLRHRDGDVGHLTMHHRLDVWTSGVLVFGRSKEGDKVLSDLMQNRTATKRYRGICVGTPPGDEGCLEDFLKKHRLNGREKMMVVTSGGKKAITKYSVAERRKNLCSVVFELVTGRRHQIRVQTAHAGFPILGDRLYSESDVGEGQRLHAESFSFHCPLDKTDIEIVANPPTPWFPDIGASDEAVKTSEVVTVAFYKPYGVHCRFTKTQKHDICLGDFDLPEDVYPVGRLDKDSEGLLVLTNSGSLQNAIADPKGGKEKVYWVQVEGIADSEAIARLAAGVTLKDGHRSLPARVATLQDPKVCERNPPVRFRKTVPTSWLEICLREGKNRQVRRMTAAVGFPTLRLIRVAVAHFSLGDLRPGQHRKE